MLDGALLRFALEGVGFEALLPPLNGGMGWMNIRSWGFVTANGFVASVVEAFEALVATFVAIGLEGPVFPVAAFRPTSEASFTGEACTLRGTARVAAAAVLSAETPMVRA
jgi:hypothetical protein